MLRLILIFVLIGYLLYKIGFFRFLTVDSSQQPPRPRGGNVNIDSDPAKEKKRTDFKGGEYVDYEEVKD